MSLEQREGEDLMNFVCGQLLGSGQFRHVYRAKFDDTKVLKYERQNTVRSNIFEYDVWCAYKDVELGRWLAPCYDISPDGTWLIQAFTENLRPDELPKDIPALFTDLKLDNWGLFEGRPVCRDYGYHKLYGLAQARASRLIKVGQWRIK
jgi:hypothetical protein